MTQGKVAVVILGGRVGLLLVMRLLGEWVRFRYWIEVSYLPLLEWFLRHYLSC